MSSEHYFFIYILSSFFHFPPRFHSSDRPVKMRGSEQTPPAAVYWSLMRSQKRTASPSDDPKSQLPSTPLPQSPTPKCRKHTQSLPLSELHRRALPSTLLSPVTHSPTKQWHVLSGRVVVDFFEIQHMQPWVFTYSSTSFKCASHENESSASRQQSQIKVPPKEKKNIQSNRRALRKMSALIPLWKLMLKKTPLEELQ